MSREESQQAAAAVQAALPHVAAFPVDPRRFLVLAWDRRSVEMMLGALRSLIADGGSVPEGIMRDLQAWLNRANAGAGDE